MSWNKYVRLHLADSLGEFINGAGIAGLTLAWFLLRAIPCMHNSSAPSQSWLYGAAQAQARSSLFVDSSSLISVP